MPLRTLPDQNLGPLLLYAEYHLILNYSGDYYEKLRNLWNQKYVKYTKHLNGMGLTEENLYQHSNAFLLLSGHGKDLGQIKYYTKSLEAICGNIKESYVGSHVLSLFTPSTRESYGELLKQLFEAGEKSILNRVIIAYLYHKDGYIVEVELYITVHPYITQNLYLNVMIRPIPSSNQYILVKENGDIEGATRRIASTLCISALISPSSKPVNIQNISEGLYKANQAFNIVHRDERAGNMNEGKVEKQLLGVKTFGFQDKIFGSVRQSKSYEASPVLMDLKKATEIYSTYTQQRIQVRLLPFEISLSESPKNTNTIEHVYNCKMSIIPCEPTFLKLIELKDLSDADHWNITEKEHHQNRPSPYVRKITETIGLRANKMIQIFVTSIKSAVLEILHIQLPTSEVIICL